MAVLRQYPCDRVPYHDHDLERRVHGLGPFERLRLGDVARRLLNGHLASGRHRHAHTVPRVGTYNQLRFDTQNGPKKMTSFVNSP